VNREFRIMVPENTFALSEEKLKYERSSLCCQKLGIYSTYKNRRPGGNPKKMECVLCDFKARDQSKLNTHTRAVHLGVKSWKFEQCDYASSVKGTMTAHVANVHVKMHSHECKLCDYGTSVNIGKKPSRKEVIYEGMYFQFMRTFVNTNVPIVKKPSREKVILGDMC
jgi:ribosomal protein L33